MFNIKTNNISLLFVHTLGGGGLEARLIERLGWHKLPVPKRFRYIHIYYYHVDDKK